MYICECDKLLCEGKCTGEVPGTIYGKYLCEACFEDCLTPIERDEIMESYREE